MYAKHPEMSEAKFGELSIAMEAYAQMIMIACKLKSKRALTRTVRDASYIDLELRFNITYYASWTSMRDRVLSSGIPMCDYSKEMFESGEDIGKSVHLDHTTPVASLIAQFLSWGDELSTDKIKSAFYTNTWSFMSAKSNMSKGSKCAA